MIADLLKRNFQGSLGWHCNTFIYVRMIDSSKRVCTQVKYHLELVDSYKTQSLYSWPTVSTDMPLTENIFVCVVVFGCNLLRIAVLEGREKTICEWRSCWLRGLGVEAQQQLQQFSSAERCWWELLD